MHTVAPSSIIAWIRRAISYEKKSPSSVSRKATHAIKYNVVNEPERWVKNESA